MSEPAEPPVEDEGQDLDPPDMGDPDEAARADVEEAEALVDERAEETEKNIEILEDKVKKLQGEAVIASDRGDAETLSKTLLQLARINSALGKNAAYAQYIARNTDRAARRSRAANTLDLAKKQAVNKSELQAELDAKEHFTLASEMLLLAERASDLCFRTDTFLKMAQSRLSLIKGDIRNA